MNDNSLSLLIKAMLDSKSTSDILTQIEQIQQKINQNPLNFKINIDSKQFNELSANLQKIGTSMGKALNVNTSGLDKVSVTMNTTTAGYEFMEKKVKETTNAQGQLVKEVSKFKQEVDEAGNAQTVLTKRTEETTINYKKQREEAEKLRRAQQKLLDDFNKKNINGVDYLIKQRELEGQQFSIQLKAQMLQEQELLKEKQKTAEIQKQIDLYKQRMLGGNGFAGELDIFSTKQKGKFDEKALSKIRNDIEALNISTPDLNNKIKQTSIEFSSLKQQASQSGNVMTRALDNAFKFLRFYLVGGLLVGVVGAFRDAINVVVELDASLTELNKVIDISKNEMSTFTDEAYEMGKTIGRTGKEVIDATAEFAKAGYTLEQSFELSKAALVMQNVAEGINSTEEATSSLIAILKGYSLESTKAMQITDILNEVSNTTATNFDDLADGLRRTSGTLSQTGTSLEQLTGLLVGGFEPLRNIEQVSSGLIMISQRLRGIGEDGEAIDGLMPKLQKDFKEIANIDIIDPKTNGLRSTYDILQDMARVFPTLSDKQRQYLGELAAGNRQVKVLNAILSNWQSVEGAIDSATNSMGSAMKENEKYLNSINGKMQQFTSSVQSMWNNTIDSDFIKWVVDAGTAIITLVDKIGLLPVAIGAATLAFSLFSKTAFAGTMQAVASAVASLAVKMGATIPVATGLATALAAIAPLAIVTAIYGLVKAYDALNVSMQEYQEQVNNSYNTTQSNLNQIKQLKSEYESLASKTELTREEKLKLVDIEHELNTKFADTNESIDLQNDSLETNIQKIDELTKKEAERFTLLNERAYKASKELLDSQYVFSVGGQAGMVFDSIEDAIEHFENVLKDSTDKGNLVYNERKRVLENLYKEYDAAKDIVSKYEGYQTLLSNTVDETTKVLEEQSAGLKQQAKSAEELAKLYDSATDSISDFSSSAEDLNSIFEDINEGQEISEKQLLSLIGKYPEFASQIVQLNNSKEDAIKLTNLLFEAEKTRTIEKLKNDKEELQSELYKLEAIRSAYIMLTSQGGIIPNDVKEGLDSYNKAFYQVRALDEAIKKLRESTLGDFKSGSNTGSKSTPSPIPYQDISSELIATYNTQVELDKLQAKSLERQIKTAEAAKDYNKAIELQNELLKNQEKTIADIKTANEKIHESANKMRKDNAQYDTTGWFDRFGNATQEYLNLIKSFEGKTDEASKRQLQNIERLFSDLQKLKKAWNDNADAIISMNDSIAQTKENIVKLEESRFDAIQSVQKKMMELRKKDYGDQIKAEDERHKQAIKNIDDEISKLEERYATEDYLRDLQKQDKAIVEKQAEINALALDTSVEGMARKAVLQKELDDLLSKKSDDVEKHRRDEAKKTLEKAKDAENEKYNYTKKKLEDLTTETSLFNQTQIELAESTVDELIKTYGKFFDMFEGGLGRIGSKLKNEFTTSLAQASSYVKQSSTTTSTSSSSTTKDVKGEYIDKIIALKEKYMASKSGEERLKLHEEANEIRKLLPADVATATDVMNAEELKKYKELLKKQGRVYKEGGLVDFSSIIQVDGSKTHPEYILKSVDFKNLLKTVDIMKTIIPRINQFKVPTINNSNVNPSIQSTINVYSVPNENVDGLVKRIRYEVWNDLDKRLAMQGIK